MVKNNTISTGLQNRFDSTMDLLDSSNQLQPILQVLEEVVGDLNHVATRAKQKIVTVQRALTNVTNTLDSNVKEAASFSTSSAAYALKRKTVTNEQKIRKSGLVGPTPKKTRTSEAYKLVRTLATTTPSAKKAKSSLVIPRMTPISAIVSRTRLQVRTSEEKQKHLPHYPAPANEIEYQPPEVVAILSKLNSRQRPLVIKHWLAEGMVGVKTKRAIDRLLVKHRNGKPIPPCWNTCGRPAFVSQEQLQQALESLDVQKGSTLGKEDINKILKPFIVKNCTARGIAPIGKQITMSNRTAGNYFALAMAQSGVVATTFYQQKTNRRFIAEHSLRAAMCLLLVVGSTHFHVGSREEPHLSRVVDTKLRKMVSNHLKAPVYVVKPHYVTSTDDTTVYVFAGVAPRGKGSQWRLTSTESLQTSHNQSLYEKVQGQKHLSGFRVKYTFTFAASGIMAPLYVTVSGLSEVEMPIEKFPDGMFVMEVPGLAVGAASDPFNQQIGYVVFLRSGGATADIDIRRQLHYRKHVFLPFVEQCRLVYDNYKTVEGATVPKELTVVSYQDGEHAQLMAVTEEGRMTEQLALGIYSNKGNPSRTSPEQAADNAYTFMGQKAHEKVYTMVGKNSPLKSIFEARLKMSGVKLKKAHHDALVDNVACCPDMLSKCASPEHIRPGFSAPGYIDTETGIEPSWDRLLATCKHRLTVDEAELFESTYPVLLGIMLEKGHVDESVFDNLGFPKDLDMNGDPVERHAAITNEKCRRACILSHEHVRGERKAELEMHILNAAQKANEAQQMLRDFHDDSEKCLSSVKLAMGGAEPNIEQATFDHFFKPKADLLKAFIHCRKWPTVKKQGKWPKKGQPVDAAAGEDNLIKQAYDLRSAPIMLQKPRIAGSGTGAEVESANLNFVVHRAEQRLDPLLFVVTEPWLSKMKQALDSKDMLGAVDATTDSTVLLSDLQERGDTLAAVLAWRLQKHIRARCPEKRNHWVWDFVLDNIARISLIMEHMGHIRRDVNITHIGKKDNRCLLKEPAAFIPLLMDFSKPMTTELKDHEGCYLYYFPNEKVWIRSGKVAGRGFNARHGDHARDSKLQSSNRSRFYRTYPSKMARVEYRQAGDGSFESLQLYCGLAFDRTIDSHKVLTQVSGVDAAFHWSDATLYELNRRPKPLGERKLHMVAYLFEIAYDLCLSKNHNVSDGPGFESFGFHPGSN